MKVAFFVGVFPKISETFILNQITGLIDRGHRVDIYAFHKGELINTHPEINQYNLLEQTRFFDTLPDTSMAFAPTAIIRMARMIRYFPWYFIRIAIDLMKAFRFRFHSTHLGLLNALFLMPGSNRYDIIHCQFGSFGPLAIILKTIGAIEGKLVTSFRGHDATKLLDRNPHIYNRLFKEGDLFLPVSNSLKKRIIEAGCSPGRIIVHHSGIDCNKFIPNSPKFSKDMPLKLLTVGRLVEKKGIAYAIQAIAELKRCNHRVIYTVIGDGYLRPALEKLVEDLDLKDEVKLIGYQTNEVVLRWLQKSHILIAPSVTANGDQEGIPNALKEAMAMGLPVVGTFHGGIPELIEDGVSGFLVPERDPKTLAERLIFLIKHPEVWPEFGRQGSKKIRENFDIALLNDRLVVCYHKILGF